MSIQRPFKTLVKLIARAFYDGENQPNNKGRSDNRGIGVVVLDALTRRQWVREEDLAKDLKLHSKQLRRTLRFFEEEKLVTRDHRKETAQAAGRKEGEEKIKLHTHSYCCLDYAQIYDVVRYRLHRMKKKIKEEVEQKNTIQEYICPNSKCGKRYTVLDALWLVMNQEDQCFRCENCKAELVAEIAAQQVGDGDDKARKGRREKFKDMLQKMEEQIRPLVNQLGIVQDLPFPEFGTLQAWEARAGAARLANGDSNPNDPSKSSQGGYSGTQMPFLGDTEVEVAFSGAEGKGEEAKSDTADTRSKFVPQWFIKPGMNLTKEQRGEVEEEDSKTDAKPAIEFSEDKKSAVENKDEKYIMEEYAKAYYAALLERQKQKLEADNALQQLPNTSDAGMKSKREDDDKVEREEAPVAVKGRTEGYKANNSNVQADASGDEEEDDDIWEED